MHAELNTRKRFIKAEAMFFAIGYFFRHPVKFFKRATFKVKQFTDPYHPTLASGAVNYLKNELKKNPNWVIGEWGSGRSTIWFAGKARKVVSVEHDSKWHKATVEKAAELGIKNVAIKHVPNEVSKYSGALRGEGPFDIVLVDGNFRKECAAEVRSLIKPGGYIILDDADREEYRDFIDTIGERVHRFKSGVFCTDVFRV